jgi:hypothetical protein
LEIKGITAEIAKKLKEKNSWVDFVNMIQWASGY